MCDDFGWEKTSDTWSLTASKKLSDTKVYYADGVVYSDYFYVYGLILFNNDYDVLWNRVSVNELIEEDPNSKDMMYAYMESMMSVTAVIDNYAYKF